jgi:hypothetical protein
MTKPKFFYENAKKIRDDLMSVVACADKVHQFEKDLIENLYQIDQKRLYVKFGYKSLRGFCINGLKFSKTQGQRIVMEVRRHQTTVNIGAKRENKTSPSMET